MKNGNQKEESCGVILLMPNKKDRDPIVLFTKPNKLMLRGGIELRRYMLLARLAI